MKPDQIAVKETRLREARIAPLHLARLLLPGVRVDAKIRVVDENDEGNRSILIVVEESCAEVVTKDPFSPTTR